MMLNIFVEGISVCFFMLLVCVIGIANGAEKYPVFYEKNVKERVIKLGIITEKEMKKKTCLSFVGMFLPVLLIVPASVYFVNGARTFGEIYGQTIAVLYIGSIFDKAFIDWYWVGHIKTWIIKGTEDLLPYITKKVWVKKIIGALLWPHMVALISALLLG